MNKVAHVYFVFKGGQEIDLAMDVDSSSAPANDFYTFVKSYPNAPTGDGRIKKYSGIKHYIVVDLNDVSAIFIEDPHQ